MTKRVESFLGWILIALSVAIAPFILFGMARLWVIAFNLFSGR
jgi:hypothetical protein